MGVPPSSFFIGTWPKPFCSDPRLSPLYDSARFRRRFKLTYGRRLMAAPLSRLRRARAQEDEAILINGSCDPIRRSVRPPGSTEIDQIPEIGEIGFKALSGGFHDRSFDNDASAGVLPERDQKFARERDDRRFAQASARFPDPLVKPSAER